jgi:hypothetical protein
LCRAGRQAALAAVDAKIHFCYRGVAKPPECCPKEGCHTPSPPMPGVDYNSEKIEDIESTQDMTCDLDPDPMTVHVSGTINYRSEILKYSQPTTFRDAMRVVDSHVDLTKGPPVWFRTPQ